MSGSGRDALPDYQKLLGGPPGCSGVVGKPFQMYGRPSRVFGSVRTALPDVREFLSDVR